VWSDWGPLLIEVIVNTPLWSRNRPDRENSKEVRWNSGTAVGGMIKPSKIPCSGEDMLFIR